MFGCVSIRLKYLRIKIQKKNKNWRLYLYGVSLNYGVRLIFFIKKSLANKLNQSQSNHIYNIKIESQTVQKALKSKEVK